MSIVKNNVWVSLLRAWIFGIWALPITLHIPISFYISDGDFNQMVTHMVIYHDLKVVLPNVDSYGDLSQIDS